MRTTAVGSTPMTRTTSEIGRISTSRRSQIRPALFGKRLLLGLGIAAAIAIVGFGVWYFAIRDTGPSAAEQAAARAAAAAAQCQQQVGALLSAEEDLDGRLSGSGMTEGD